MEIKLSLEDIKSLLGNNNVESAKKESILDQFVGKYVICRTYSEGVNFGKVIALDSESIILEGARRLHHHKPKSGSWFEGVANNGLADGSRVSEPVNKAICEPYSISVCSKEAIESILNYKSYEA